MTHPELYQVEGSLGTGGLDKLAFSISMDRIRADELPRQPRLDGRGAHVAFKPLNQHAHSAYRGQSLFLAGLGGGAWGVSFKIRSTPAKSAGRFRSL